MMFILAVPKSSTVQSKPKVMTIIAKYNRKPHVTVCTNIPRTIIFVHSAVSNVFRNVVSIYSSMMFGFP